MTISSAVEPALPTIAGILAAMAVVSVIEVAIPLHQRSRWNRAHLAPNLILTFTTFATNLFMNAALLAVVVAMHTNGYGILPALGLPPWATAAIAVVGLDFSFYVAHVAMHAVPLFWRFHRVHHSDPAVDVTTTIRQHPGEGVIRYAFMAAFAVALGPSPVAFGIYRFWSALNGLLEHANIRVPAALDRALALVTTWPNMHKVHHSRLPTQTNTNYGNIFSFFDRLFLTFTPSDRGVDIDYGLAGFDDLETQSTAGLMALPFRELIPESHAPEISERSTFSA